MRVLVVVAMVAVNGCGGPQTEEPEPSPAPVSEAPDCAEPRPAAAPAPPRRADRMRIVSPIARMADITDEQREAMTVANFHTALDARYAASNGVLYSAFLHPLSPLQEDELRSALHQVATLNRTFGSTYSSGKLMFGGGAAAGP